MGYVDLYLMQRIVVMATYNDVDSNVRCWSEPSVTRFHRQNVTEQRQYNFC